MLQPHGIKLLPVTMLLIASTTAFAQSTATGKDKFAPNQAVREGNRLLKDGDAAQALKHYNAAADTLPDSREVAFDQALAHYALGEYDKARASFGKAIIDPPDKLANDALYGMGTCDHSQALASQDPRQAIPKLESAMQNYQRVLTAGEEHAPAKDAHYKAGSYWRQLKQIQQQQQQQQQQGDENKEQEENENQESDSQQQSQQQKQSDKKDQQQASKQDQQNESQQDQQNAQQQEAPQQQNAESKPNQAEKEKEDQANAQDQKEAEDKQKESDEKKAAAHQKPEESITREQAQRQLREMMQALRDRQKLRREEIDKPPLPASDKDW